jgi:Phage capsid family
MSRSPPRRGSSVLYEAAACVLRAAKAGMPPEKVARTLYPGDDSVQLVLRAASAPATVADPAWAGIVAHQVVSDLLQEIVSISAGAALLSRSQQTNFDRRQSIRLPQRLVDPNYAGTWLAEGQPIPVYQYPISAGVTLTPKKLGVICVFTHEMIETSNIESLVRSLLSESAALALDKALFGSQADDGVTPPGLLNGVAPLAATAIGSTSKRDTMISDLGNLVQALADNGGGADPTFVCAPGQAIAARLNFFPERGDPIVLASMALPAGTVVCIETRSLVATITASMPQFSVADATLLQMADDPVDVVSGTPTRSVFQLDALGLKMTLDAIDWKMRAPHVAWVQNVNW